MAIVVFTADQTPPPIDARLEETGAVAGVMGKPIRVRIQPDLYDYEGQKYQVWNQLTWTVDLADVAEGRKLREGLTMFFKQFGRSPEAQAILLASLHTDVVAFDVADLSNVKGAKA